MKTVSAFFLFALLAGSASAQDHHADMHAMSGTSPSAPLHETGQGAFAAIAEVTARLEADPATDWSKVDMNALHDHLVDMDNVTLRANVVSKPVAGGARFEVTSSDSRVQASIRRMVRMHAAMAGETGEKAKVEDIRDGVALTLTGADSRSEARIRGLGFYGSLTSGVHHQRHHLAIAEGEMHH